MSYTYDDYIKIKNNLKEACVLYYIEDNPTLEDAEYDAIYRELITIEAEHPDWVTPDSPSQTVGVTPLPSLFIKREHATPMLSLDNIFNEEETLSFLTSTGSSSFVVEPKIDGLAVSLHYNKGKLQYGATRGNGTVGEDVTQNLLTIETIPTIIPVMGNIEIRGEVCMYKEDFIVINAEREAKGLPAFKNPRNAASGSLKQLDVEEVKKRKLNFIAYQLLDPNGTLGLRTHVDTLVAMGTWGFQYPAFSGIKGKADDNAKDVFEEVLCYIKDIELDRNTFPYVIDGAVIKVSDLKKREELGASSHAPKWSIAYKYPPERGTTKIKNIFAGVGRTGSVTPVAEMEPITLAGSVVQYASLHNMDNIAKLGVKIGDTVIIHKAAEIIPQIIEVLIEERDGTEVDFVMPEVCPSCGSKLVKPDKEVIWRCPNDECPSKIAESIINFAGRDYMDIQGLGDETASYIVENGMAKSIADVYYLHPYREKMVEDLGPKIVENLFASIEESKSRPFERVLASLGIRFVGKTFGRTLANKFGSMDKLMATSVAEFTGVDGIGDKVAVSLYDFLHSERGKTIIQSLKDAGVSMQQEITEPTSTKFQGMSIVITGTLSQPREYFEQLILANGGKVGSSVSKKTSMLLVGTDAGSKLTKAQELGIKTIIESEFMEMIG